MTDHIKRMALIFIILLSSSSALWASPSCTLTMTYKDVGKSGYMAPSPSNKGFYKALYSEAAHSIGCSLNIKRFPKKRTLKQLQSGVVDIYPSTGFDNNRSSYLFYTPNGLYRKESYYGLTPIDTDDIKNIKDIRSKQLIWVIEAGRTTIKSAQEKHIPYQALVGLTASKAIQMLKLGRKVFYQIDTNDYNNYLVNNGVGDLTHLNIKTHKNCCQDKSQRLYTGISRFSPIYQEQPNPYYDSTLALSPENFPTQLVPDSIAHQLSLALQKIYDSGRLGQLLSEHNIHIEY